MAPSVDLGTVHHGFPPRQLAGSYLSPAVVAHPRAVVLQWLLAASWFSGIPKRHLVGFVSMKRQFAVSVISAHLKLHNTLHLLTSVE